MMCPVCGSELDEQQPFTEQSRIALGGGEFTSTVERTYQHYICDDMLCGVSSLRIEWRTQ